MSSLDMTLMADMAQQQDITLKDTIMSPVAALDGVPLASVNGDLDAKHVDSAPEVPTASPTPLTLPSYVDAQQLQTAAMMATAMMSYHQALNLFGVTPSPFGTSLDASCMYLCIFCFYIGYQFFCLLLYLVCLSRCFFLIQIIYSRNNSAIVGYRITSS